MRLSNLTAALLLCSAVVANARQPPAVLHVEVRSAAGPVAGAVVAVGGMRYTTDQKGTVTIAVVPGRVSLIATGEGFAEARAVVEIVSGAQQRILVELQSEPSIEEEVTVVASTRTDARIDDVPMRVEVLGREEIEEKMLMTPGDIVMMLNEMGGMRVQATSPAIGAASVRIQGMRGRYTRFLSDGLPLFGEHVGSLGLLQIPPMDLGQVEVIKGVASSLYGAGAMGGIVNLISRRPAEAGETEFLLNRSSRGATDAVVFNSSRPAERWGFTLLGSGHWHEQADVDDDRWANLPRYTRGVVRPRAFWDDGKGSSFFATAGITFEDREGGSSAIPHIEALETLRWDAGAVAQWLVRNRFVLHLRGAAGLQDHDHRFGEIVERDRHHTAFGEVTLRGTAGRHTWVAGAALESDVYRPRDLPQFRHTFTVPGVFVQDDMNVASWLSVSASARVDRHSEYGTFLSPRVGALVRSGGWNSRLSIGRGFFGPSALTEETEASGLTRLVVPRPLVAEEGRSASVDVSRQAGPASYTVTLFTSRVRHAIAVDRSTGLVLTNLAEPTTNSGVELLATLRRSPFGVTATYTYVRARELNGTHRDDTPLTPRHSAGLVGMWEREDVGRVGVEWYYTGVQRLAENPYRTVSEAYVIVGVLAERQFGRIRLFINGENLTGTRQTRWDPLLRPDRAADGRWTVDAWAPLEGRTVNGGLRIRVGGQSP